MKKIFYILFLGLVAVSSQAEEYTLTTGEHQPPHVGTGLPQGGMLTETITAVFKEMGHTVRVDFLPWKRGYLFAKKGFMPEPSPISTAQTDSRTFLF